MLKSSKVFAAPDGCLRSWQVMLVVKCLLAKHDITICSTIHSPTPFCFRLFDRLMILLRGQVVYFGSRGAGLLAVFFPVPPASRVPADPGSLPQPVGPSCKEGVES